MRVPLSLLHVEYEAGDALGKLLALVSQAPIFVMVAYATLIASRRDLGTASLALGQLLNEALNYALKHALREPRPASTPGHAPEFGMPSNHAQFAGFAAAAVALWAARRWRVGARWRALAAAAAAAGAAAVCASRLYLGYHTRAQVAAGAAVGAAAGAAWHAFTEAALRPRFAALAATRAARWALVRDCSDVNVIEAEYAAVAGAGKRGGGKRA